MHLNNRTIQLTQCCTQLKSPGVKILCVLYLNYNVAFSFKWYGNSWNKPFYSQRVWIAYNIEALIFFRLLLSNCLSWKIYCDDHSSLSSTTTVQKWIILFTSHQYYISYKILKQLHNISRACIMHLQGEKGSKGDTGSKGDNGSPCQCSLQVKANSWQIATGIVVKQFFNSNKT